MNNDNVGQIKSFDDIIGSHMARIYQIGDDGQDYRFLKGYKHALSYAVFVDTSDLKKMRYLTEQMLTTLSVTYKLGQECDIH